MSDWNDLFPSSTSITTDVTAPVSVTAGSLDLREEFDGLILGGPGEEAIGQPLILRRMRRDSDGDLIECSVCMDDVYHEPDRDLNTCPYCFGRGFLFDEEVIYGYVVIAVSPGGSNAEINLPKMEMGYAYLPAVKFFLPYDVAPTIDDRIVTVELDDDGDAILPYNRLAVFELMLVRGLRGSEGRLIYWACNGQQMGPKTHGSVS